MFEKHLWKSDILSKDTSLQVSLPQVFFKHLACKNQLPGVYIKGTLVENGLRISSVIVTNSAVFFFFCLLIYARSKHETITIRAEITMYFK